MIIDTTYILPLAGVAVKTDLLRAIAENLLKGIDFGDLKVSLVSILELQAKASRLNVPPSRVYRAIDVIFRSLKVVPFYKCGIIEKAHELRKYPLDYVDRVILATAISLGEDLATEDSRILSIRRSVKKDYGVRVVTYDELICR
mgnify:FL=1